MGVYGLCEYDNLYVTVKKDRADEVTSRYAALGWERVSAEKHPYYFNELNLQFRRPHKTPYREEKQLLQVYLENAMNGLSSYEVNPYPKTTVYGLTGGLLLAAIIAAGICLAFILGGIWFTAGIITASSGAALYIPYAVFFVKIKRKEKLKGKLNSEENKRIIDSVCAAAAKMEAASNE